MKEAIKLAIEGGYDNKYGVNFSDYTKGDEYSSTFLDPLFWQCLGKSLGWVSIGTADIPQTVVGHQWLGHWHSFIDHLAKGKDPEEFFTNLTK
jgi:hypothetical protein